MDAAAGYRPTRPRLRRTLGELDAFLRAPRDPIAPDTLAAAPRGDGRCVLVLPCALRGDRYTAAFRAGLAGIGYAAHDWSLGSNLGPTRRLLDGAEDRLIQLALRHGPVSLVGFTLGGLFARWLASRHPGHVRQVVTVCSPFRAPVESVFVSLRPVLPFWRGRDVARRPAVPTCALYSRADGIVAWESCRADDEPALEIAGHHATVACDAEVFRAVAEVLAYGGAATG